MQNIKTLSLMMLMFCYTASMAKAQEIHIQCSDSSKLKIDKIENKLLSIRKQLEEVSGSQQEIGDWVYAMMERNTESLNDIQETEVHLNMLSTALLSTPPIEKAIDWFKPRGSGLHLYNNDTIGVGIERTDKGIQFVSLFDLKQGIELLNKSNTSIFRLSLSSGKDSIRVDNESSWNATNIQWNANDKSPSLTFHFTDSLNPKLKGLSVICQIKFYGSLTHWTLETKIPAKGLSLLESEFPSIDAGPIGKRPEENVLHYPKGLGIATPSPYSKSINYSEIYPN